MTQTWQNEAQLLQKKQKRKKTWTKILGVMACAVVFCTTYALILPAITQETETFCGFEEHAHEEACFEKTLICTETEAQPDHVHIGDCYETRDTLLCTLAESGAHTHTTECAHVERTLACTVAESQGHTHTPDCETVTETLICTDETHAHEAGCYESVTTITCGLEETEGHAHSDGCYTETVTYTCGLTETGGHTHGEDCYGREETLICAIAAEGHVHTDDCYEETLICETEEHTHEEMCYSDPEADVETAADWEKNLPDTLTGEFREDVLAVAKSQLGYQESTKNYWIYEDGAKKGYSRYGDWYGDPYGDWCAMFVSFCLHYAEVADFPLDANCQNWIESLSEEEYFNLPDEYTPSPGDIVFFNWDDSAESDHVGLVAEYIPATEYEAARIKTIEGNSSNQVQYVTYLLSDERIMGYGILPEQTFYCGLAGHVHDSCGDCGLEEHVHTDECLVEPEPVHYCGKEVHEHTPACYDTKGRPFCQLEAHVHSVLCDIELTDEERRQIEDVILMIDGLPDLEETKLSFAALEAAGDTEALAAQSEKIVNAVTAARDSYYDLSSAQRACVSNSDTLNAWLDWLEQKGLYDPDVHLVKQYTDGTYTTTREDPVSIVISGKLPEGAEVRAFPVEAPVSEADTLCTYDISIFLEDGTVYQPEEPVTVTVSGLTPAENADIEVCHVGDNGRQERVESSWTGDTVTFTAEHFSVYTVIDARPLHSIAEQGDPEAVQALVDSGYFNYWEQFLGGGAAAVSEESYSDYGVSMALALGEELTSDRQIESEGGTASGDGVSISKTIEGTDVENVFDITLKVTTTTNITELHKDPDMAVVIVMDISNTMNDDFGGSTRYVAAMESAEAFIDMLAKESTGISRVGYVAFNTDAHEIFGLSECSTTEQATALKNTMRQKTGSIVSASGYSEAHTRFTNVEAGLKRGYDMLAGATNENKYIIFLSDGFPTTYISSGYKGYDPYTPSGSPDTDGVFYDAVDRVHCDCGTSYSDKAAIRAREMATTIKNSGAKIFSIGIDIGGQTITKYDTHRGDGFSVIDRTGETYEIGSADDTSAFKTWLGDDIGSGYDEGYYYDSTDTAALKAAYEAIFAEIQSIHQSTNQDKWIASDPMPLASDGSTTSMEFLGFYDNTGQYLVCPKTYGLVGTSVEDGEDTATFDVGTNAISWDLKKSGYTTKTEGSATYYTYEVKYRVRLKNELSGFVEKQDYDTNGTTTLTYRIIETVDGVSSYSEAKTLNFPIPQVEGYLGDLNFTKVTSTGKKLAGAEFTLTHDDENCNLCRGDGRALVEAMGRYTVKAVSGESGEVSFTGLPSGHDYVLVETQIPDGYQKPSETFAVNIAYDVVTVTVTAADGTTSLYTIGKTPMTVTNVTGYELPDTGGAGTSLYIFSGFALLLAAALVYCIKRRPLRKGER